MDPRAAAVALARGAPSVRPEAGRTDGGSEGKGTGQAERGAVEGADEEAEGALGGKKHDVSPEAAAEAEVAEKP